MLPVEHPIVTLIIGNYMKVYYAEGSRPQLFLTIRAFIFNHQRGPDSIPYYHYCCCCIQAKKGFFYTVKPRFMESIGQYILSRKSTVSDFVTTHVTLISVAPRLFILEDFSMLHVLIKVLHAYQFTEFFVLHKEHSRFFAFFTI